MSNSFTEQQVLDQSHSLSAGLWRSRGEKYALRKSKQIKWTLLPFRKIRVVMDVTFGSLLVGNHTLHVSLKFFILDFNFLVLARKVFFTKYKKVCKYRGRGIIPLFDARAGKQQFFTNFHAAASQEVFQERPGLLFLKTSPKKPSFIILQTWILPDYTTQYTNTALKTSRKLCLLVVERASTTFA